MMGAWSPALTGCRALLAAAWALHRYAVATQGKQQWPQLPRAFAVVEGRPCMIGLFSDQLPCALSNRVSFKCVTALQAL